MTTEHLPRIAAFPKCYIEEIAFKRTMSLFEWIEMAKALPAEGLELYEGFLTSHDNAYLDSVGEAISKAGFAMPMMCCSPDFTHPDADMRRRAFDHEVEMIRVTRRLGGPGATCRVLSGQRYPEVALEQGIEWVVDAITRLIPIAREYDVVLGMENHYKDGAWRYPEFAQKKDVFLRIVNAIPERTYFGVQYDPSNAIVAGDDPIALLHEVKDRIVSMHASDRYLAEGVTLDALRQSDGTLGYSPHLRHGVTGKGLNDYHAIFRILREVNYARWISIEDGMNGMDEMRESLLFLHRMREEYFGC
ncbi:MAG: sugar phosphate isomerase/epimerase family protein [Anaerolineae bacterium]|nr:sugar phosphate isomerase/epimerase [Candidatus Roseilinea sp.]MDW8450020.1 sugar phosphate isomerase/epimerase family protein [Anaerolineae bacterium]